MKTLQNNFTTPEQSKQLLELGVPADSADLYYDQFSGLCFRCEEDYSYNFFDENFKFIPVWSVGRLIEIIGICESFPPTKIAVRWMDSIEWLIGTIETFKTNKCIDFSKLED